MPSDIPQSIVGEELPEGVFTSTVVVDCEHIEKMLHKATRNQFTFYSDEPERLGGDANHPAPLAYIVAGIGFWLLTQLKRYASMRKVGITSAKVHVELDYYLKGSVKQGTVENKVTEVRSDVTVESKDPESDVLEIIRIAKQGCFAENLVKNAVPLKSSCLLNG